MGFGQVVVSLRSLLGPWRVPPGLELWGLFLITQVWGSMLGCLEHGAQVLFCAEIVPVKKSEWGWPQGDGPTG